MERLRGKYSPSGIAVVLLCLVVVCGITLAYMFAKSDFVINHFSKAVVSCEVQETLLDSGTKSSVTVKNTSNIPVYIRIRLVSYWVNEQNEIVAKSSEMPTFTQADGWVALGDHTYCYSKSVETETPNFLKDGTAMVLREEDGFFQVVEIFADAIQSEPTTAVAESWGVAVNAAGEITGKQ